MQQYSTIFINYVNILKYLLIVIKNLNLKRYSGENIMPVGLINVKVKFNRKNFNLKFYIVDNGDPPLLGIIIGRSLLIGMIKLSIGFEINNINC